MYTVVPLVQLVALAAPPTVQGQSMVPVVIANEGLIKISILTN